MTSSIDAIATGGVLGQLKRCTQRGASYPFSHRLRFVQDDSAVQWDAPEAGSFARTCPATRTHRRLYLRVVSPVLLQGYREPDP